MKKIISGILFISTQIFALALITLYFFKVITNKYAWVIGFIMLACGLFVILVKPEYFKKTGKLIN